MANTYNGWTNRETWLVNLYFGDAFLPLLQEELEDEESKLSEDKRTIEEGFAYESDKKEYIGAVKEEIAERYEQFFDEMVDEDMKGLSSFLTDFIDFGKIDWYDLADSIYSDLF
jgi:hypothetical protein